MQTASHGQSSWGPKSLLLWEERREKGLQRFESGTELWADYEKLKETLNEKLILISKHKIKSMCSCCIICIFHELLKGPDISWFSSTSTPEALWYNDLSYLYLPLLVTTIFLWSNSQCEHQKSIINCRMNLMPTKDPRQQSKAMGIK